MFEILAIPTADGCLEGAFTCEPSPEFCAKVALGRLHGLVQNTLRFPVADCPLESVRGCESLPKLSFGSVKMVRSAKTHAACFSQ